jgi:hypothetical protein
MTSLPYRMSRRDKANWGGSVRPEVSSSRPAEQASSLPTSNFTLETPDAPPSGLVVQTNPIWRNPAGIREVDCAKQTQFGAVRLGRGLPVVQNKANFGESRRDRRAKCAKRTQFAASAQEWARVARSPVPVPPGSSVRNKANSQRTDKRLMAKELR